MARSIPAVRSGIEDGDGRTYIEIDARKGKWPFLHFEWLPDDEKWSILIDANRDPGIGGKDIGMVKLSNKRVRALRDFLNEVDLDD